MNPSATTATPQYLFLLRNTVFENRLSLQEMQEMMGKFSAWIERFHEEGKHLGGQPLAAAGKVVSGQRDRSISDGPFAEAKEAIGGYLVFAVDDLEAATAIAQTCPLLDYGATVEVRPVLEQCVPGRLVAEHQAATERPAPAEFGALAAV